MCWICRDKHYKCKLCQIYLDDALDDYTSNVCGRYRDQRAVRHCKKFIKRDMDKERIENKDW